MRMYFASDIVKERRDCGNLAAQIKIAAVAPLLHNDNKQVRIDNKELAQSLRAISKVQESGACALFQSEYFSQTIGRGRKPRFGKATLILLK